MKKNTKKSGFGFGLVLTGILAAAGATAVALLKKKKREEVYHEAELKAMNELDDLMAESEAEDCETCACGEECSVAPSEPTLFDTASNDDLEETVEEPIEDVAAEDTDAENPQA